MLGRVRSGLGQCCMVKSSTDRFALKKARKNVAQFLKRIVVKS